MLLLKRLLCAAMIGAFALVSALAPAEAALKTTIRAAISAYYTGTGDLGASSFTLSPADDLALPTGTASGSADKIFADQRTLAASATEDLDLAGVLADPLGATLTFVKVKAIYIKAAAANTNNVIVGAAASADFVGPWSADGTTSIPPGGVMLITAPAAGWTVTATTADLLKIANSGGSTSVVFDIVVIGTGASSGVVSGASAGATFDERRLT